MKILAKGFGLSAVLVLLGGVSLSCDLCGNTRLAEYPSPNGDLKVVVFERDCGATTGFSTQASVVATDEGMPSGGGNAFVVDSDGSNTLQVKWLDASTVQFAHPAHAHVYKAESQVLGIRISQVSGF